MFFKNHIKYLRTLNHYQRSTFFNLNTIKITKLVRDCSQLTKFKLSVLNSIVTLGPFFYSSIQLSCISLFFSSLSLSMSTQVFNQYIEVEHDKQMLRTCRRPLVLGMNKNIAFSLGIFLGVAGIYGLSIYNLKTALIGFSIFFGYLFIYTKTKRTHTSNTLIGSIFGALPIYLGWVASGQSVCALQPFAMFVYMIAWQFQHFYGIRFTYFDDYNKAGFKMQQSREYASLITIFWLTLAIFFVIYQARSLQINRYSILSILYTFIMYKYGIKSTIAFSKQTTLISSKLLKLNSYYHFTFYFLLIFANDIYRWYNNIKWQRKCRKELPQYLEYYV